MNEKDLVDLWVKCNAKEISQEDFLAKAKIPFYVFGRKYKKVSMKSWNEYHRDLALKFKQKRKQHKECICEEQKNKNANSFRVSDNAPQRLWKCPEHGNCFIDL